MLASALEDSGRAWSIPTASKATTARFGFAPSAPSAPALAWSAPPLAPLSSSSSLDPFTGPHPWAGIDPSASLSAADQQFAPGTTLSLAGQNITTDFLGQLGYTGSANVTGYQTPNGDGTQVDPGFVQFLHDKNIRLGYNTEPNITELGAFDSSGKLLALQTGSQDDGGGLFGLIFLAAATFGASLAIAAPAAVAAGTVDGAVGAAAPAIGNGAFLGEGIASGVPAWDAAALNAGLALDYGAAAALPAIGNGAFVGENIASGVPAWDAAATNAGLTLTTPLGPLASAAIDAAPASAATTAASSAPSSSSLLPSLPSLQQAGQLAGLASTVSGLVSQLTGGAIGAPSSSSSKTAPQLAAASAAQTRTLLLIGGAVALVLILRK